MAKAYIIKNIKSGLFFTRYYDFDRLGFKTYLFPTMKAAERYIDVAKRQQVYRLLEQMYNKDIYDIDIDMGVYDNILEHVEMNVFGCYMCEGLP